MYSNELDFIGEDKITLGQVWENQPPVMHWCFGISCLSFGFVYLLLFAML